MKDFFAILCRRRGACLAAALVLGVLGISGCATTGLTLIEKADAGDGVSNGPALTPTDAVMERQDIYIAALSAANWDATIDIEEDISFHKLRNTTNMYYILIPPSDPTLFQLSWQNLPDLDPPGTDPVQVAEILSIVNRRCKVAKAYITGANQWAIAVEMYLPDPNQFAALLSRLMDVLQGAYNRLSYQLDVAAGRYTPPAAEVP